MAAAIFSLPASTRPEMSVLATVSRPAVRLALSLAALLTKSPGALRTASAAGRIGSIIRPVAPGEVAFSVTMSQADFTAPQVGWARKRMSGEPGTQGAY